MPTIDLPQGTVHYRVAGPEQSSAPPVVFVHGFLVDGSLWDRTAQALAAAGVRSYAPDWPLGSHRHPLAAGTDNSPRGIARQIVAFLGGHGAGGRDAGGQRHRWRVVPVRRWTPTRRGSAASC